MDVILHLFAYKSWQTNIIQPYPLCGRIVHRPGYAG